MNKLINILVVEDSEERIDWFQKEFGDCRIIFARTARQGIRDIDKEKFDVIFLDHDLGDRAFVDSSDANTGYQVARRLPGSKNKETLVIIHSWNPEGVKNIQSILPNAARAIFGSFNRNIIK